VTEQEILLVHNGWFVCGVILMDGNGLSQLVDTITVNAALGICEFDRSRQVEETGSLPDERPNNKICREHIDKLQVEQLGAHLSRFIAKLQEF